MIGLMVVTLMIFLKSGDLVLVYTLLLRFSDPVLKNKSDPILSPWAKNFGSKKTLISSKRLTCT